MKVGIERDGREQCARFAPRPIGCIIGAPSHFQLQTARKLRSPVVAPFGDPATADRSSLARQGPHDQSLAQARA